METKIKAVVLAAGKGMRFRPLTNNRPKPLLKTLDKAVLEHNLNQLNRLVDEVILVIGYRGEIIKNTFGFQHRKLKIRYLEQNPPKGTGDAAKLASPFLKDKFLLLNGDDLYSREDIERVLSKFPSILLAETKDQSNFGAIDLRNRLVKGIIEKPKNSDSQLVNTGLYFLPKKILNCKIELSPRGEYEFTDCINSFVKKEKLYYVQAERWCPLSYPWNLFDANEFLLAEAKRSIEGRIEKNCRVKGKIILKEGAVVGNGSHLEGPIYIGRNSVVGSKCRLKGPLSIGTNVILGQGAEVEHSIIGDRSEIDKSVYVADSIIGGDCKLAAGTKIINSRPDKTTIKVNTNGKVIDTNLIKFGCIIGDGARIGGKSSIMPGVVIGKGAIIGFRSTIINNVPDDVIFSDKTQKTIKHL
ncbi:MAG: Glucose-1-phosphate thymidylyltransferase [Parcubacteria group bacterium GW2011_GWA1_36_12]|nr:MAG: Glucose-1-phosphate thymidylyltransferase [Parcubacteria group bacterium GW2011_GWA1_36_12]